MTSCCDMLTYSFFSLYLSTLLSSALSIADDIRDFGSQVSIIETNSLPTLEDGRTVDSTLMPSVGNGHIATVIYNDTIYMNGLYNGELSESHRARIPAEINLRVRLGKKPPPDLYRQYRLDMKNGYWEENVTMESCRVTHRIFAHQFYTRLMVTEIIAQRQGSATGNLVIYLDTDSGVESNDLHFAEPTSFNGGNWNSHGTTKSSEIPGGHKSTVYTFWSTVPPMIHIPSYQNSIRYTFLMSIDSNEQIAKESFESGSWIADKTPEHFFDLHKDAWHRKWGTGGIELSGDTYLEKLAYSSYYYLLSSLPSMDSHRGMDQYGGASSGGLAHGGAGIKERGVVSWDQERWILPAVLPFYPSIAKSLLTYRINTMPAATVQAKSHGYKGLLYSWKSAATGIDVTPPYEPRNHYHVNGDISFALRQYIAMSRDRTWMQQKGGCDMARDIAELFYSKMKWNDEEKHYDLNDVTTVDGSKGSIDNSVYTNALASLSLHFTKYAACLCNLDVNKYAPQEWIHAAQSLHWEYNSSIKYNPAYEGFHTRGTLKQSGAILLGFPILWNVDNSLIRNNINMYTKLFPDSTPSTSWAMLAINLLQIGDETKAQEMFSKSYSSYVSNPFKIWKEYPNGMQSNYLSGAAGYLQVLMYGYGGLRIHPEHLIINPRLPKNVHSMTFRDINYLGSKFNIRVTSVLIHISVTSIGIYPLRIINHQSGKTYPMNREASIPLPRGKYTIKSKLETGCPLPEDNILPYSSTAKPKYTPAARTGLRSTAPLTSKCYSVSIQLMVVFLFTSICLV